MQADWEFEIGAGAPVIDACWPGLVDLRRKPDRIGDIGETALVSALAPALLRMNSASSLVWTAKCDVWAPETIDLDEVDAPGAETKCALACYIDLLPSHPDQWSSPAGVEAYCRRVCRLLTAVAARCCRADLVVRCAVLPAERQTLGITAYLTGCGESEDRASEALSTAVSALADSVGRQAHEEYA
ncbi:MAG TPA: hypothetical protein VMU71_00740 [Terracidiphilus sp.]|nr:hypothetical protein [Terracidiphilus sp.]